MNEEEEEEECLLKTKIRLILNLACCTKSIKNLIERQRSIHTNYISGDHSKAQGGAADRVATTWIY